MTPNLKTELWKTAKLGNIQAGLPSIMRVLPVVGIAVGETLSRATGRTNKVEELLLGTDTQILLETPSNSKSPYPSIQVYERAGVMSMCTVCSRVVPAGQEVTHGLLGRINYLENANLYHHELSPALGKGVQIRQHPPFIRLCNNKNRLDDV